MTKSELDKIRDEKMIALINNGHPIEAIYYQGGFNECTEILQKEIDTLKIKLAYHEEGTIYCPMCDKERNENREFESYCAPCDISWMSARQLQAYNQNEIDELKTANANCISLTLHEARMGELERSIAILKSKESQFQSTLTATMAERDELNVGVEKGFEALNQLYVCKAKLKIARDALDYYGEKNSWNSNDLAFDDEFVEVEYSDWEKLEFDFIGGKRARKALKETE